MEEGPGPGGEGQWPGGCGARLHLSRVAVEVREETNPDGVRAAAGSFENPQVSDDLGEAFPKSNAPEVDGQGSSIEKSCPARGVEHFQVIDRHLEDLGLLQL